ncbi:MAG: DUF853 family protein [Oscillospiraceae bacterium]|nr:DUF853 family protein [Candidatus Limimonas coprohippi]
MCTTLSEMGPEIHAYLCGRTCKRDFKDLRYGSTGQLGNRIQHALRAFTPKDQKGMKAAAETFRENPEFNTADAISELATGEALVSFLDESGTPSIVERARILFPLSQIGAIVPVQRQQIMMSSAVAGKYDQIVDRESAFEVLLAQSEQESAAQAQAEATAQQEKEAAKQAKQATSTAVRSLTRGILGNLLK